MDNPIVILPLDLMGNNPNNYIGGEEHLLVTLDDFPYKIIPLFYGGFYTRGLKVFDENLNLLEPNADYICTYRHAQLTERTGLEICSAIVFINPAITDIVYTSAQMVGGDLAFSFTVVEDYIAFFNTDPTHVPTWSDYDGQEPIWGPGELAQNRWGLDTFQPMNNELENISRRLMLGAPDAEDNLRNRIRDRLTDFLGRFNDTLDNHVADQSNPHQTTAELVLLGNVRNLDVATVDEAIAMQSDDVYLTPALAWQCIDVQVQPLYDHININPGDPHDIQASQINAHTAAQTEVIIAGKQDKGSTINVGNTLFHEGAWRTYDAYLQMMRRNLTTDMFPTGMCDPAKMANGPLEPTAVMRGDRRWSRVADILSEKLPGGTSEVYYGAYPHNNLTLIAQTIGTTQPFAYAPVSSIYVAQTTQTTAQGYGNGETYYNINERAVFIMSASGWVLV